jgi:hypothetical protein
MPLRRQVMPLRRQNLDRRQLLQGSLHVSGVEWVVRMCVKGRLNVFEP